MAMTGLRHAVFAPIKLEQYGMPIVYDKGMIVGRMIMADIAYERNTDPLYADDTEAENDNSITGGSITVQVDDILDDARVMVFGDYEVEGSTGEYEDNAEAAPYGGFGYVRVRTHKGKTTYVGYWVHKCQFGASSESAQTRANTISWQTPTMTGRVMGVTDNADGRIRYRRRKSFDTPEAAIAWVNQRAGITTTA